MPPAERKVNVSVWQMKDTTGALAALQWLQPGVVQHGNYVLRVEGRTCRRRISRNSKRKLPKVDRAANPSLPAFLPGRDRVKHSERYVLGTGFAGEIRAADSGGSGRIRQRGRSADRPL